MFNSTSYHTSSPQHPGVKEKSKQNILEKHFYSCFPQVLNTVMTLGMKSKFQDILRRKRGGLGVVAGILEMEFQGKCIHPCQGNLELVFLGVPKFCIVFLPVFSYFQE